MAFIGMRHVVVAKMSSEGGGGEPTYSAGMVAGKAITGNLTINRNSNPLYADDIIAEDDNGVTSMDLELGLDDLSEDVQDYIGLMKKVTSGTGTATVVTYYETAAAADYMGVGYVRVRRKNGTTSYQAIWIYKVLFSLNAENSQTKGETIEWQTPTINGRCMGVATAATSNAITYRKVRVFSTAAEADTWLNGLANISTAVSN